MEELLRIIQQDQELWELVEQLKHQDQEPMEFFENVANMFAIEFEELHRTDLKDKLSALRDQSTGNDCPGQDSIYQTDIKFDEDLVAKEIEEQGKATTKDGQQCLRMTV